MVRVPGRQLGISAKGEQFWGLPDTFTCRLLESLALGRIDTGGEVNFHAQNERTQIQKEHHFRLRHQYQTKCARLLGGVIRLVLH